MSGAPGFFTPDWPAPARVRALCSTRAGGFSRGPYASLNLGDHVADDPDVVERNRALLRHAGGLPGEPAWLNQVHGCKVQRLEEAGTAKPAADAAWTDAPGRVCAILTADCLPVILCDRGATVVAAAHAGWRGLAAGVLEATVAALPVPPGELLAWLGPAISQPAFEVGEEVRAAFVGHAASAAEAFMPGTAPGKYHADLYRLARQRLSACGLEAGAIYGGGLCTYTDAARFYSHRRDGACGRMATLIWLAS